MGQGWGREDKPAAITLESEDTTMRLPYCLFVLQRLHDGIQPRSRIAHTATVSGREWGEGLEMHSGSGGWSRRAGRLGTMMLARARAGGGGEGPSAAICSAVRLAPHRSLEQAGQPARELAAALPCSVPQATCEAPRCPSRTTASELMLPTPVRRRAGAREGRAAPQATL